MLSFFAYCRGPGTHDCLFWLTKTRQHGGENVPAQLWSPVVQGLPPFPIICPTWRRAKPRTLSTIYLISTIYDFECGVWTWFYFNRNHRSIVLHYFLWTGTIARIDRFHRNHGSTFPVGASIENPCSVTAICFISFLIRYSNFWSELSLQIAAWVRASAATIDSCYPSFQVIFIVWCLLHAR